MDEELLRNVIVATGAFLGIIVGIVLRREIRDDVVSSARASVKVPEWSLSDDDRTALQGELEDKAAHRLADAPADAVARLAAAERYIGGLESYINAGPASIVENAATILAKLTPARTRR